MKRKGIKKLVCACALTLTLSATLGSNVALASTFEYHDFMELEEEYEKEASNVTVTSSQLPSAYDLRNVDGVSYVTSVKSAPSGYDTGVWYTVLACAESNLIKKGYATTDIDLSETHLAYFSRHTAPDPLGNIGDDNMYYTGDRNFFQGPYSVNTWAGTANFHMTYSAMASWKGVVLESTVPYSASYSELARTTEMAYLNDQYHLQGYHMIERADQDAVKNAIMTHGAVAVAYKYFEDNYNSDTGAYYSSSRTSLRTSSGAIVGWDDNFSKDNFNKTPNNNGAWLLKVTQGYGKSGYIWLSYEDATMSSDVYVFDMEPANNYDNNYQYDFTTSTYSRSASKVANVFETKGNNGKKEVLEAVSIYLGNENVRYSLQIYKNPTDMTDPTSGTPMLSSPQVGETAYIGYYTIPLKQKVVLKSGDVFSVVFELEALDGSEYCLVGIEYEGSRYNTTYTSTSKAQQSYAGTYKTSAWSDYGAAGTSNLSIKAFTTNFPTEYTGNINSELISFDLKQNDSGAYYLTGEIVVVEWIDGVSNVPYDTPTMIFKSTDGTEEIDVFVTPTGTNTYYFDRFIEGLSPNKEYVFEIASGTEENISPNRSMNVLLSTSPKMVPIKNLGKIGEQKLSYYKADNGELRLYRQHEEYVGHINSELIKTELVKGPNGNYVSGQIVVVEWVNDVSTVPLETPIMYFKSTDGTEELPVFITPTGTNTYYFDRSLGDMDTSKEYVFTIESGDELNVSPYRAMIVTTAAMENKEGTLWESDTQYVNYRTDPNTAELRIYAVNK